MSGDYGANYWSSDKVWKRRKMPPRTTPLILSFRLGIDERDDLDFLREYLISVDDSTDWNNLSMLLRRAIKLAKVYAMTLQEQKKEKEEKKLAEEKEKGGVV